MLDSCKPKQVLQEVPKAVKSQAKKDKHAALTKKTPNHS